MNAIVSCVGKFLKRKKASPFTCNELMEQNKQTTVLLARSHEHYCKLCGKVFTDKKKHWHALAM